MGFERNRTFVLVFDDEELAGLEVSVKPISAAQMLDLMDLMDLADDQREMTKEDKVRLDQLFRVFAGCPMVCADQHVGQGGNHYVSKIKEWNLTEDGHPVPPTYAGLMSQDMQFVQRMVFGWMDGQVGTPGDLGKDSNAGGRRVEESIPMDVLSVVLPN